MKQYLSEHKALPRRHVFPLKTDLEDTEQGKPLKDDSVIKRKGVSSSYHFKNHKGEEKDMMMAVCCLKRKLRRETAALMDDKVMRNFLS